MPALLIGAVAILGTACGGGGSSGATPTAPSPPPAATPAPSPTPPPPPAPPPFRLVLQNGSLSAANGCANTVLTVSANQEFAGTVSLECAGQPAGLTCGFGPQPSLTAGSTARVGVTVNAADPAVPTGTHSFQVRGRSGDSTQTAAVQVSVSHAAIMTTSESMAVTGCAGGTAGAGSTTLQSYGGAIVGAFRNEYAFPPMSGDFCVETNRATDGSFAMPDGSFLLRVPRSCFRENQPVYMRVGGAGTCVSVPFRAGQIAYVDILSRPVIRMIGWKLVC